ncbi:toxin VasX [Aliamphritea ceti]|uniref:toxin VasX n=1 Tax=Aliamphritea ceti TaxID=1524258 RepID=UPI0021C3E1D7|nr:toxin VasX [Aliamphritea ceti]
MPNYTIQPGDSLSAIAQKHNVSLDALKQANPAILPPDYAIRTGDQLVLPAGAKATNTSTTTAASPSKSSEGQRSNDAAKANFRATNGVMAQCPNQKEWIVVMPLRYGVQQKHGDSFQPQKLKISGLKSLQKHIYVPRPLMPGYVYLYSQKQGHILEAEYGDNGPSSACCAAGNAPAEAISGTNLQAQKDDTIELLYTPCQLPGNLVAAFQQNDSLRKQYFKTVSVTAARGPGTANASPLCELPGFLTDCNVASEQFDWSIQSIQPDAANRLLAAANSAAPDNHIAVVLPDPITITTELALLFDAQYDVAMTSIAQTQHPYLIGKTTEQLLNKLTQNDYDRNVPAYTIKTVRQSQPSAGRILNPNNVKLAWELTPVYGYDTLVIPRDQDGINAAKTQNRERAKQNYIEQLNYGPMQDFLATRDDYTQNLGKALDEEATDWLKWLDSKELNLALSFYTAPANPVAENLEKLEAALSNMTLNLQTSDKGAALRNDWVDKFVVNLNPDEKFAEQEGAGWYILLMMAGKVFQEANKVNKQLIAASGINYGSLSKTYTDFFTGQNVRATLATDQLNLVFGERLAQLGVHTPGESAFFLLMERQSYRYGYNLFSTQYKMSTMLNDIQSNFQQQASQALGTRPTPLAAAIESDIRVRALNLAEPAPVGKVEQTLTPTAKWFVGQLDKAGLVKSDATVVQTVEKAGKAFEKFAGKGLGILFLGQVFNFYSVTQSLRSEQASAKDFVNLFSSLSGLVQTSFVLIQRILFAGDEAAMKAASKVLLQDIGIKTHTTLKGLSFTTIRRFEETVNTKNIISKLFVRSGRAGYKVLPVVGNLLAVISSGFNIHRDFNKDESLITKAVGITSGGVNTLALGCAIVALVSPAAPLVAVTGIILAVAGIVLGLWHSYLQVSDMELFLKGTFWGKGNAYKYDDNLTDIAGRLAYYEALEDASVHKTAEKELTAFCHQLYKPILTVDNYQETDYGRYENFTLNIHLPGFNSGQKQPPYFKLTAERTGSRVTLYETGQQSLIPASQSVSNPQAANALFTQIFELNETKQQMDFEDYQLELKHHNPAGFPVTLHYQIEIDDDSKVPFFTSDVSFDVKRLTK